MSRKKLNLETLESREVPAVNWLGGTGNWSDPTKWQGNAVPQGLGVDVEFPAGSHVTVDVPIMLGSITLPDNDPASGLLSPTLSLVKDLTLTDDSWLGKSATIQINAKFEIAMGTTRSWQTTLNGGTGASLVIGSSGTLDLNNKMLFLSDALPITNWGMIDVDGTLLSTGTTPITNNGTIQAVMRDGSIIGADIENRGTMLARGFTLAAANVTGTCGTFIVDAGGMSLRNVEVSYAQFDLDGSGGGGSGLFATTYFKTNNSVFTMNSATLQVTAITGIGHISSTDDVFMMQGANSSTGQMISTNGTFYGDKETRFTGDTLGLINPTLCFSLSQSENLMTKFIYSSLYIQGGTVNVTVSNPIVPVANTWWAFLTSSDGQNLGGDFPNYNIGSLQHKIATGSWYVGWDTVPPPPPPISPPPPAPPVPPLSPPPPLPPPLPPLGP